MLDSYKFSIYLGLNNFQIRVLYLNCGSPRGNQSLYIEREASVTFRIEAYLQKVLMKSA